MDFRPIFLVVGLLLATLALVMLVPAAANAFSGHPDWEVFAICAGVTLFVGVGMALTTRIGPTRLSIRQAFVMTTLSWLFLTFFASLPFVYADQGLSFTDAFFEAISGITTTGSTVITGLDQAPTGILLWRALLQWLGGIGIIVMAIAVLPMLKVGGMQLFRVEAFDTGQKALPRAAQIAAAIVVIYITVTIFCATALWAAGMTGFEALVHAMTALSTGGFSTSDESVGHFDSALIDAIVTAGMIAGSLPFVLYLRTLQGEVRVLFSDSQVQWFLTTVGVVVLMAAGWLWLANGLDPLLALRLASFNIVSVITGTGYVTSDYSLWGSFVLPIFFFIMFIGGCAGSTT
ncbi:MAG: TrkH family potassium uptake protein, partial [Rhodospirillales bacterium]